MKILGKTTFLGWASTFHSQTEMSTVLFLKEWCAGRKIKVCLLLLLLRRFSRSCKKRTLNYGQKLWPEANHSQCQEPTFPWLETRAIPGEGEVALRRPSDSSWAGVYQGIMPIPRVTEEHTEKGKGKTTIITNCSEAESCSQE